MNTKEVIATTTKINEANAMAKNAFDACVRITQSNYSFLSKDEQMVVFQAQKVLENLRERTNEHEIQNYLETGRFTR